MSDLHPEASGPRGPVRRVVEAIVDFSIKRPLTVIVLALLVILAGRHYISAKLELRSDFLELLPRDSPGFLAFEHQLNRVGGGASLIVVVESPDRAANEKAIDELSRRVEVLAKEKPQLISYVETGTKEVRKFFQDNRWLYADIDELERADQTLDNQIAIQSGMVDDLEAVDDEVPASKAPAAVKPGGAQPKAEAPKAEPETERKKSFGLDEYEEKWKTQANKHDDFPTGYFASPDGTMLGIRIVSPTTGTGDRGGDTLLESVRRNVAEMDVTHAYQPEMKVGYAGDIPNAIAEKESIVSEAAWATGLATVLIVVGIVAFFRSFSAIFVMLLPIGVGISCAYSFATATFGYVNTSGAFLGAIILGNGINYPIVLLGRYQEFRARGMAPDVAKKAAVWNAFRAELVGASVAGIAYGSLVITRFRGFSQFGMIGLFGMLLVWLSIIPLVPATVTLFERLRELPVIASLVRARDALMDGPALRWLFPRVHADGTRGPIIGAIAWVSERFPRVILVLAAALTVVAAWKLPAYVQDPWEYNFARLGSRGTKRGGAGEWSVKAEKVFGGKMNIAGAMMLADDPAQTLAVKEQILANDAKDPKGQLVHRVATVYDLLPGTKEAQDEKLAVLERIRERLTPRVIASAPTEEERKKLEELVPPETLRPLVPGDLPSLMRRRFEELNGTVGTVFYVSYKSNVSLSDGRNLLRIAATTDNIRLPDGTLVQTASRSSIFAEMIRSMTRDGPLASIASLLAVSLVVAVATASVRGWLVVVVSLLLGVVWMVGGAAWMDMKLNFLNFIALPITFGIGSEYPFNIFDRTRLLAGDVSMAVKRSGGAVAMCSFTTVIGYGSLLVADNQALQSFGRLAVAGELTTLVAAMFVVPALLHVWKRRRQAA